MQFTAKEYINLKSDILPYTTPWGFTINKFDGYCSECSRPLTNMKYLINDYSDFSVVRGAGICHSCKLIVSISPMKITKNNGHYVLENNQWIPLKGNWYDKLKKWMRL